MRACADGVKRRLPDRIEDRQIAGVIRDLLLRRGAGKTICPSEAARALASDWRPLMGDVRRVAADMQDIEITQKGLVVDPAQTCGPIRLRLAQDTG